MLTDKHETLPLPRSALRNRFDRLEWAGAFGDFGTLVPFVVAYISLLKMDPYGILLAFGLAQIVAGLYWKTPFPIQPMKAIGAVADDSSGAKHGGHSECRLRRWHRDRHHLVPVGITGAAKKVADLVSRPVVPWRRRHGGESSFF